MIRNKSVYAGLVALLFSTSIVNASVNVQAAEEINTIDEQGDLQNYSEEDNTQQTTVEEDKLEEEIVSEDVEIINESDEIVWGRDENYTWNSNSNTCKINGVTFKYYNNKVCIQSVDKDLSGDLKLPDAIIVGTYYYKVDEIGYSSAFSGCENLTSITIPKGISKIPSYCFSECSNLKNIFVDEGNLNYSDLDGILVSKDKTNLLRCPAGRETVNIPSCIDYIESYAFDYMKNLTSISIPKTVLSMGDGVFSGCYNLKNISIPDSIRYAGSYLFLRCDFNSIWGSIKHLQDVHIITDGFNGYTVKKVIDSNLYDRENYINDVIKIKADSVKCIEKLSNGEEAATELSLDDDGYFVHNPSREVAGTRYYYYKAMINGKEYDSPVISVTVTQTISSFDSENKCLVDNIQYMKISDESVSVYSNNGVSGEVEIPKFITVDSKNYYVKSINENAFLNCSDITKITIPDTVESIGNNTFEGCSNLTEVVLGSNLKNVGSFAFKDCTSLTSLVIPASVESVGNGAFGNCTGLEKVRFEGESVQIGNEAFVSCNDCRFKVNNDEVKNNLMNSGVNEDKIGDIIYALNDDGSVKVTGFDESASEIVIPSELKINGAECPVKSIESSAFKECSNIEKVTIEEGVESIGEGAFYKCSNITDVILPSTLKNIGNDAFKECSSLKYITFPEGLESIGSFAFKECTKLKNLIIPSSVKSVGEGAFWNCIGLDSVEFEGENTAIGENAFYLCSDCDFKVKNDQMRSNLENSKVNEYHEVIWGTDKDYTWKYDSDFIINGVKYPYSCNINGVNFVSNGSYAYVYKVYNNVSGSLRIPDKIKIEGDEYEVVSIMGSAFYRCEKIDKIIIPNSVTSIEWYAFSDCSNLTRVTIPSGVTSSLSGCDFSGCDNLQKISVDKNNSDYCDVDGVLLSKDKKILIKYPSGKENIEIPSTVEAIGIEAFCGNDNLTELVIPDNVKEIYREAFSWCENLTSVSIPASVTDILSQNFIGCPKLQNVFVDQNNLNYCDINGILASKDEKTLLYYPQGRETVYIPSTIECIGKFSFKSYSGLTSVNIPNNVKTIEESAFEFCSNLKTLNIPNSIEKASTSFLNKCSRLKSVWGSTDKINALNIWQLYNVGVIIDSNLYNRENYIDDVIKIKADSVKCIEKLSNGEEVSMDLSSNDDGYFVHNPSKEYEGTRYYYYKAVVNGVEYESPTISVTVNPEGIKQPIKWDDENKCVINNIEYTKNPDGGVRVCGNNGASGEVKIPNYITVNGINWSVRSICENAFENCSELTKITIPDTVESIGNNAFEDCSNLTEVVLGSNLKNVGSFAFKDCTSLNSLIIPSSVESIGDGAFWYCIGLEKVDFEGDNVQIGNGAFFSCNNCRFKVVNDEVKNVLIDAGINEDHIGNLIYALNNDGSVSVIGVSDPSSEIIIPSQIRINGNEYPVKSIEGFAFKECSNITKVTIEDGVEVIGEGAFNKCNNLTDVILPSTLKNISNNAFTDCSSLENITLPEGLENIGSFSFQNCTSLKVLTIPSSVESIGNGAFWYNMGLENVEFEEGNTDIGSGAFYQCYDCEFKVHSDEMKDKLVNAGVNEGQIVIE